MISLDISAVITTHQRPVPLRRAVASAICQTYKAIEIIVVSDGRDPETDALMAEMLALDARIRYEVVDPPEGANAARNRGIETARGEWVAFLDDDDEWLPDKLRKQKDAVRSDPEAGIVYTAMRAVYEDEKRSYAYRSPYSGDLSRRILLRNYVGATSTVLARRASVIECGMFDCRMPARQDYDLWIRLCQITRAAAVTDVCVNYFNERANRQTSRDVSRYVEAFRLIEAKYAALYSGLTVRERREYEYNKCKTLAMKGLRNGNKKEARRYALLALRCGIQCGAPAKALEALAYAAVSFFSFRTVLALRRMMNRDE